MPPFQSTSTGARRIVEISSFGVKAVRSVPSRFRASALSVMDFSVRGNTPPPGESSDDVVVGPAGPGQLEQPLALGEGHRWVGIGVDEDVAVVERGDQLDVPRAQHAVAEHVAGHVADADDRERVGVGVLARCTGRGDARSPTRRGR